MASAPERGNVRGDTLARAGGTSQSSPRARWVGVAERLRLPGTTLRSSERNRVDLPALAAGALVLYLFPGAGGEPHTGADDAQHRAYRNRAEMHRSYGVTPPGVSSDAPAVQRERTRSAGLAQQLLSDTRPWLGKALDIPTFTDGDGARRHEPLTLVAQAGRIVRALHPIQAPGQDAGDALTWLLQEGVCSRLRLPQGQRPEAVAA